MKKWAIIDTRVHDEWVQPFETKKDALESAEEEWGRMTLSDRNNRLSYVVGLVNLDADGNYAELDNGEIDIDIYEVAKYFTIN